MDSLKVSESSYLALLVNLLELNSQNLTLDWTSYCQKLTRYSGFPVVSQQY